MPEFELSPTLLAVIAAGALCACFDDPAPAETGSEDPTTETSGDGDGDPAGDGDGDDSASGDGDGDDSASGDGDGDDSASGDGDGDDPTTDEPVPECGDGIVDEGEVCDAGPNPMLVPGACKPDCSGMIETRMLVKSQTFANGDFGGNPVAAADAECPPGFEAMFVDGVTRRATTTPWVTVDPIDWPIEPYTHYVNEAEDDVWVTDEVALIGIRDGEHVDVPNPLGAPQTCAGMICSNFRMITGMRDDGTTLASDNCNGWSSAGPLTDGSVGSFSTGEYATGTTSCDFDWMLIPTFQQTICVEVG